VKNDPSPQSQDSEESKQEPDRIDVDQIMEEIRCRVRLRLLEAQPWDLDLLESLYQEVQDLETRLGSQKGIRSESVPVGREMLDELRQMEFSREAPPADRIQKWRVTRALHTLFRRGFLKGQVLFNSACSNSIKGLFRHFLTVKRLQLRLSERVEQLEQYRERLDALEKRLENLEAKENKETSPRRDEDEVDS
jgi:hypothetical protein